jgi:hypothetical protein
MRMLGMGFGLVALLITVAIMAKLWSDQIPATIQAGNQAQQQVQQIAGVTQDGTPVEDTYKLSPQMRADGKLGALVVKSVATGSPLAAYFGLQLNDAIISSGYSGVQFAVSDAPDTETAELTVRDAYARSGQIIVMRDGQKLTLPQKGQIAPAQPLAPTQAQAQPQQQSQQTPAPSDANDPMQAIKDRAHSLPGY